MRSHWTSLENAFNRDARHGIALTRSIVRLCDAALLQHDWEDVHWEE
jgi:hypothetical protein